MKAEGREEEMEVSRMREGREGERKGRREVGREGER